MVDEAVGDAGLVGDVGDARAVESLAGEDPDRGVEDRASLVDGLGACHQGGPIGLGGSAAVAGARKSPGGGLESGQR